MPPRLSAKSPIRFDDWGITLLSISAHKFYGPQGVGALVVRRGYPLEPPFYGGGHQKGLRSGTLNLPGIVGLGEACRLRSLEMEADEAEVAQKRGTSSSTCLVEKIPDLVVNGDQENRLAGNLHISVPGIPNSAVIARLRHKLAIFHRVCLLFRGLKRHLMFLRAMNLEEDLVEGSLRIGLGKFSTYPNIEKAADILAGAISHIRKLMDA